MVPGPKDHRARDPSPVHPLLGTSAPPGGSPVRRWLLVLVACAAVAVGVPLGLVR